MVDTELLKRRGMYALDTMRLAWILTFKQFMPLFIGWAASLGGPVLMLGLGVFVGALMDHAIFHHAAWFTLIFTLIPGLLIGWMYAGWILISLKVAREIAPRFSDLFRPLPVALNAGVVLVIVTVCSGLLGMIPVIGILPAAALFLKWQLAPYYVIDRGYGPMQALQQSWADTDRLFAPLVILDLIFCGLTFLSGFTIVGPFLCHMALAVASAVVYTRWLADPNNPEYITQDHLDRLEG